MAGVKAFGAGFLQRLLHFDEPEKQCVRVGVVDLIQNVDVLALARRLLRVAWRFGIGFGQFANVRDGCFTLGPVNSCPRNKILPPTTTTTIVVVAKHPFTGPHSNALF